MKIGLIVLFVLYLVKLFINRRKVKKEYDEATERMYDTIEQTLGQNDLKKLKAKTVWKDMPECFMYYVLGKPEHMEQNDKPGITHKTWYYDAIPNARSNAKRKYKGLYYSQNGFITHWDIQSN
jgi:hypothetical protein